MLSTTSWSLPSYCSSAAKLANMLRSKFHVITQSWHDMYKHDPECGNLTKKKCPKPITTRWGSTSDTESHVIALFDSENWLKVMQCTFSDLLPDQAKPRRPRKQRKSTAAAAASTTSTPVDEIALDATTHYRDQEQKYARQTMQTITVPCWQTFLKLSWRTRAPWQHFLAFLQTDASKYGSLCTNMSVLCTGKASDIAAEFEVHLYDGWWRTAGDSPSAEIIFVSTVTLVLVNHSEFERRVLRPCKSFPIALLCLCPEESPALRQSTATTLRDSSATSCRSTQKLFKNHEAAIRSIAAG